MHRALWLLPILTLLYLGYLSYEKGKVPELPELIDRPMPEFDMEEIPMAQYGNVGTFSHTDLPRKTIIINAFATWCSTCIVEHDELMSLSQEHGIPVYGIAYRDKREAVVRTLRKLGNPYTKIGHDPKGEELVKWRLYAPPETWIIDKDRRIRYHHKGYLSETQIKYIILPLIAKIEGRA